jgi:nucleotide-binding universal stress UspA family protein
VVNAAIAASALLRLTPEESSAIGSVISQAGRISAPRYLVGFAAAWLAFSGLESISQITPAMRTPISETAGRGMFLVALTIVVVSPVLTLLSVALLPEQVKLGDTGHFISELAAVHSGRLGRLAVVASGSVLLIFAANTAIIGTYHVFVSLVGSGFLPPGVARRSRRFGTPHRAILIAAAAPIAVVLLTRGDLLALGDLYAFGLLGAFVLTSLSLDVTRWREGLRGGRFLVGVATTLVVMLAWSTNLVVKKDATLFGLLFTGAAVFLALVGRSRALTDVLYRQPALDRRARRRIVISERVLEHVEKEQILSLGQAAALAPLYPSRTLVCLRSPNAGLVEEAMVRERGLGGSNLFAICVEERAGLFVGDPGDENGVVPSESARSSLQEAVGQADRGGFTLIPVWTLSYNAVEGIVRAAEELGVDAVMVGASQRSAVYHLLRGHVANGLSRRLPPEVRMILCA